MTRRIKNNKKGAALILIIMVVMVLMVIGTALLTVGLTDTRTAVRHQEVVQSRNVAYSGANIVAEYINKQIRNPDVELATIPGLGTSITFGEGSYIATASKPDPDADIIVISSTGTVNGVASTVKLTMSGIKPANYFDGIRQTTYGELDLKQLLLIDPDTNPLNITINWDDDLEGNSGITLAKDNEDDTDHIEFGYDDTLPPMINPPSDTSGYVSILMINSTYSFLEGSDYVVKEINVNNNALTFYTGSTGNNQYLIVDRFSLKGDFIVDGSGSLHIFINEYASFQTPEKYLGPSAATVFFYVMPGATLDLIAGQFLNAYIFAPEATVTIQSDKTTVEGAIVGHVVVRRDVTNPAGPHGNFKFIPLSDEQIASALAQYNRSYYSN
jgi:hypothetical protein